MSKRRWFFLFALGLLVSCLASIWISVPGYMDADYYFATATELASGGGLSEPFLWNYLDDPDGLPHPSHSYWMPLTSFLAAGPMSWIGISFRIAQLPFVLLSATLPLIAGHTALQMGLDQRKAWLAGLLACAPGFYLPYFVTTDTFSLFAVIGAAAILTMAASVERFRAAKWLMVGALVGLAHLTRADGFVLLIPAMIAVWCRDRKRLNGMGLVIAGYLLLMAPWWWRNVSQFGSPFPPGTGRALWLVSYDDLFAYPASLVTPQRWLESGWASLLQERLLALGVNLQSVLAANGLVFLTPLILAGMVRRWGRLVVRLTALYLGLLLVLMSFVLPQVGSRGGYFHSSAALMPVFWALAADGLEWGVAWLGQRRGWKLDHSLRFFSAGAFLLALFVTVSVFWGRVNGGNATPTAWTSSDAIYREVGLRLRANNPEDGIVAVNNPPGFHNATGFPAVVIPNGTPDTLLQVVQRYDVAWVVLEENHPGGLDDLYAQTSALPWLRLVDEIGGSEGAGIFIFEIIADEAEP